MNLFDFSDYKPINWKQEEFHKSKALNKALVGGMGAGKTMPGIYEAYFVCEANPGHRFYVLKNTWDLVRSSIKDEMIQVGKKCNCIKTINKDDSITLYNNTNIIFRPLTINRQQMKGWNCCGYLVDDPNVWRFQNVLGFLPTRLRDTPTAKANYYETIILCNWEGRDWIWQTYMRGRDMGGDGRHAYWIISTDENPTLPKDFIPNLEAIHSKEWMDRYVYCKTDNVYAGLVYPEVIPDIHYQDLSFCFKNKKLTKIMVIDIGGGGAKNVALEMATNGKSIYTYNEWVRSGCKVEELGEHLLRRLSEDDFAAVVIDPSSARKEPTSNRSVADIFKKDFGIFCTPAENSIHYGIEIVKAFLTIREKNRPKMYFDYNNTLETIKEIEIYRWKETRDTHTDEFTFKPEPVDSEDDCMDCLKYGSVYFKNKRYVNAVFNREDMLKKKRELELQEKHTRLPFYKEMYRKSGKSPNAKRLSEIHKRGIGRGRDYKLKRRRII